MRPRQARQLMGLPGEQMVYELNGTACRTFTPFNRPNQTIMRSRTFGEDTHDLAAVEAALATMAARASLEARQEGQMAQSCSLFLTTSKHKPGYTSWYEEMTFETPTNDSGVIIARVLERLRTIYNPAQAYHRGGVTLYNFLPANQLQVDLFERIGMAAYDTSRTRMAAFDAINTRFGRGHISYAIEKLEHTWEPKHRLRSPRYVSRWDELPEVSPVQ
jgi:DNA polymerase V